MNASETEVQAALDSLKTLSFVVESSGGRVMRYAHNVGARAGDSVAGRRADRRADAARTANRRRVADQLRSPASLRGHVRRRGISARARVPARRRARDRVAAPARRARNALDASLVRRPPHGRGRPLAAAAEAPFGLRARRAPASVARLEADVAELKASGCGLRARGAIFRPLMRQAVAQSLPTAESSSEPDGLRPRRRTHAGQTEVTHGNARRIDR